MGSLLSTDSPPGITESPSRSPLRYQSPPVTTPNRSPSSSIPNGHGPPAGGQSSFMSMSKPSYPSTPVTTFNNGLQCIPRPVTNNGVTNGLLYSSRVEPQPLIINGEVYIPLSSVPSFTSSPQNRGHNVSNGHHVQDHDPAIRRSSWQSSQDSNNSDFYVRARRKNPNPIRRITSPPGLIVSRSSKGSNSYLNSTTNSSLGSRRTSSNLDQDVTTSRSNLNGSTHDTSSRIVSRRNSGSTKKARVTKPPKRFLEDLEYARELNSSRSNSSKSSSNVSRTPFTKRKTMSKTPRRVSKTPKRRPGRPSSATKAAGKVIKKIVSPRRRKLTSPRPRKVITKVIKSEPGPSRGDSSSPPPTRKSPGRKPGNLTKKVTVVRGNTRNLPARSSEAGQRIMAMYNVQKLELECPKCDKIFDHDVDLAYHKPCYVMLSNTCPADGCEYYAKDIIALRCHARAHFPKRITCLICNHQTRYEHNMYNHCYNTHSGLKINKRRSKTDKMRDQDNSITDHEL